MKITMRTIELDDNDKTVISKFLKLTNEIYQNADCTMTDVFQYFAIKADSDMNGNYSISDFHLISDIEGRPMNI